MLGIRQLSPHAKGCRNPRLPVRFETTTDHTAHITVVDSRACPLRWKDWMRPGGEGVRQPLEASRTSQPSRRLVRVGARTGSVLLRSGVNGTGFQDTALRPFDRSIAAALERRRISGTPRLHATSNGRKREMKTAWQDPSTPKPCTPAMPSSRSARWRPSNTGLPSAAPDTARGEQIYVRCQACYALSYGRVGPRHCGLFGRPAGSVPGFVYSSATKNSHIVWNDKKLDRFLASPLKMVRGTAMTYAGVPDAKDRADLMAHLKSADKTQECIALKGTH